MRPGISGMEYENRESVRMKELTPEAKEARRIYRNEWAKRNPDKIREYARRYWEKKANQTNKECEDETEETV